MKSFEELKQMDLAYLESGEKRESAELLDALTERYPFLAGRSRFTDEVVDRTASHYDFFVLRYTDSKREHETPPENLNSGYTELSNLATGWRKAFGIEICEDIRTVLLALGEEEMLYRYRIHQIKEKWGSMRWYSGLNPFGIREPGLRLEGFGAGAFRTKPAAGESDRRWLSYVEEFYSSLAGHICIRCGGLDEVRQTTGWIRPVCRNEEGWDTGTPLPPPKRDEPFCVWKSRDKNGERVETSYKDMVVGSDAPIVKELGLDMPLHATEVWERVAV